MKKLKLFLLLIAGVGVALSSCVRDTTEESMLSLSESSNMEITKQATELSIMVNTNQSEWNAYINVDWIKLVQNPKSLDLIVSENNTTADRNADLLVLAGSASKKISILQTASKAEIEFSTDVLSVDQWGGKFSVDVRTNSKSWLAEMSPESDWVTVEAMPNRGEVGIKVKENTGRNSREVVINVVDVATKVTRDFKIVQDGIMYYSLPLITPESSYSSIVEFEEKNKSQRRLDKEFIDNNIICYETKNPAFPHVEYIMGNNYIEQVWVKASGSDVLLDNDFYKMLTDDGFKKQNYEGPITGAEIVYAKTIKSNSGKPFEISAEIIPGTVASIVVYIIYPLQPKDMQTYSTFPMNFYNKFGSSYNNDFNELKAWEKENSGNFNSSLSSAKPDENGGMTQAFTVSKPPYYIRAYVYKNDIYKRAWLIMPEVNKCYYEFDGKYYLTKEFTKLRNEAGFSSYISTSESGYAYFRNDRTGMELAMKVSVIAESINSGNPVVEMLFDIPDKKTYSNNSISKNIKEFIQRSEK